MCKGWAFQITGVDKAFTCKTSFQNPSFMLPEWELRMLTHFVFILMLLLWHPYFSTSCCPPAVLPPVVSRKKNKSIQTCRVTREQTQYWMCPHRKHVKMRCVSKKATILQGLLNPAMCGFHVRESFCLSNYSHAAQCLSLFPMDKCDFVLSYERQPTFRMSRWFTVRLSSFSSA